MMVTMSEDSWLEISAPSAAETRVPPAMHAVPGSTMGVLPVGQLVTIGAPGGWWLVDEVTIGSSPQMLDGVETYCLTPLAEWGAITVRPHEQDGVDKPLIQVKQWQLPTTDLWVYRPVDEAQDLMDLPPRPLLDNLQQDLLTPPSPRRPRPARELPSLTGRRLYGPWGTSDTGWSWGVAVSEPVSVAGEIMVKLISLYESPRAGYGRLRPERIGSMPLHRLWTY